MIINPDGIICHYWAEVLPQGHADRVLAKLTELQVQDSDDRTLKGT